MNLQKEIAFIKSNFINKINMIDVGARDGDFSDYIKSNFEEVYLVGIEPIITNNIEKKYNKILEIAIDDVETPEKRTFNIHNDISCSSLLEMNNELITHNFSEKDNKWFVAREISSIANKKEVLTDSLFNVIEQDENLKNDIIHFIKIDTQGLDIKAVQSLKKYLEKVVFIMMECVVSKNVVLYKGQVNIEYDKNKMKELGFEVFNIFDYSANASPEADVVFINKKFLKHE